MCHLETLAHARWLTSVYVCVSEVSAYTLRLLALAVFPGRTFVTETSMFRCGCNPGWGHMVKIKH